MNTVLLALALVAAAPGPKDAPKKDPPTVVGEWTCTECVGDGQKFPSEVAATIWLEFAADGKFRYRFGPEEGAGTYTTDPAKNPAELDYTSDKVAKGNHAIYKVDQDALTFCFAEGGRARPTGFESSAGTRVLLLTLKRDKKKKE